MNKSMAVTVITVTRESVRFIGNLESIPDNVIIRQEGQHWTERP
jgi:hypothetical protein